MTTIARNYITIANIKDGKQGKQGKQGEGGLSVMAIPSHLTFDTDQNGTILLTNNNANKARIVVFEGLKSVNPESITIKPYNCQASHNGDTITINSIDQGQANGQVEVAATYKGNTYTTALTFYVSKQRWNDAEFTTIKGKFESIQEEFERVDGEITDTKSTIEQLPEKITLEVLRHENGINLLKGASLLYPTITIDGKEHNILAGATIEQGALSHNGKPYLQVNKSQYTSNEYDGARFVAKVKANKTYTLSMYYRVVRSADQGFHLAPELKDKYNGTTKAYYHYNKTILQNNQWQRYENTFTTNQDGYLHFNPSVIRNGWIVLSEIQLEEGKKATSWTNPDKEERFRRAGIDLDLERIILQANKVYTKNSKGETTSLVDEDGNFKASSLQTFDNGKEGHIVIKGNSEAYYKPGLQHPSRWIGYEGGEWVERMYDDNGNLIWEDGKFGKQFKMRPEQWETIAERYISTHSDLKALFSAYTSNTLKQIFIDSRQIQKEVARYTAARDARGNLIASDTTDYTAAKQRDGKVFTRGGLFSTLPTSNVTPFTGFIKVSEVIKDIPQMPDTSHMTIEEQIAAEKDFYKFLVPFWYTRIREEYSLQNVYNVTFQEGVPNYNVKILQYQDGVLVNTFIMYANEEDVL